MSNFQSLQRHVVFALGVILASGGAIAQQTQPQASRVFQFDYTVNVALPDDARSVRLWLPLPCDSSAQTVRSLSIETTPPLPHRVTEDPIYGNRMLYLSLPSDMRALPDVISVRTSYAIERREVRSLPADEIRVSGNELLDGDALAPITDEIRQRAATAADKATNMTEKIRKLYDRVLADMTYDKSGEGWGRGDVMNACATGAGNCSDFHSLFIAMSRSQQVPAVFEIGFALPPTTDAGAIGGYHCWAWFESPGGIWRPVDISEADKHPEKTEYFFGTIDEHRFALSRGRDIELVPARAKGPVNFFVYPVLEINGQDASDLVETKYEFADLGQ